jgi:uncharacterized protein
VGELDPRALEILREKSGLSIDLEGRLCHLGEPITHERTLAVLWGALERQRDGRYVTRVGRESGYVRVEDAPYGVRGITLEPARVLLHLTDRSVEALDPTTLSIDRDGVLHCLVKGGHRARFTRSGQIDLGLALEEDPAAGGRYLLRVADRTYIVRSE